MSAVVDHRAQLVGLRNLYGRTPTEIVDDLRAGAGALLDLVEAWGESPTPANIAAADANVEGLRRLLGQLRLANQRPRDAA